MQSVLQVFPGVVPGGLRCQPAFRGIKAREGGRSYSRHAAGWRELKAVPPAPPPCP